MQIIITNNKKKSFINILSEVKLRSNYAHPSAGNIHKLLLSVLRALIKLMLIIMYFYLVKVLNAALVS